MWESFGPQFQIGSSQDQRGELWRCQRSITTSLITLVQLVLQIRFVVLVEIVEVVDLIVVGFLLTLSQLGILAHDLFDLLLQRLNVLIVLLARSLQVADILLHLVLALLGHESLAHAVSNGALVELLVRIDRHLDLVSHSNQQKSTLSAVDGDLANQLVVALGEELLTEGAYTGLAGLGTLKLQIEVVLQIDHVNLGGGLRRDVTHPEAALGSEFSWRQDRVKVVLITLLLILSRLLKLVGRAPLFLQLAGDAGRDEHWVVVPHE